MVVIYCECRSEVGIYIKNSSILFLVFIILNYNAQNNRQHRKIALPFREAVVVNYLQNNQFYLLSKLIKLDGLQYFQPSLKLRKIFAGSFKIFNIANAVPQKFYGKTGQTCDSYHLKMQFICLKIKIRRQISI